ncbi:hypothetical protein ABZ348_26710 [Streptomyces sp. NPDC005963]|uniref:hypothetical protein n=1 Tax=Streptomyces sp. NPDC005963 TaxID=3156721 RepID=UPI0033D8EE28
MGNAVMIRCCTAVVGVVLGLAPSAVGAAARSEVFVPCTTEGAAALNDAITEGNAHPETPWDIVLQGGCTYTVTHPYGRLNALAAVAGDIRISSRGPSPAVIARSEAAGTPDFRVLEVELGGRLTLDRITVRGGSLGNGAGIFNNFGTLTLSGSTVESNHARELGGGIATNGERASTTLHDSTVRHNSAGFGGGGLFNNGGATTLNSSRVSLNTTSGVGGGLFNNGSISVLRLDDSPVTGNRAAETAGGIFNGGRVTGSRSPVTGNLPNNCIGSPAPVAGCTD